MLAFLPITKAAKLARAETAARHFSDGIKKSHRRARKIMGRQDFPTQFGAKSLHGFDCPARTIKTNAFSITRFHQEAVCEQS